MNRYVFPLILLAVLCVSWPLPAAESVYSAAQRQEAEEQQRRISARLGALEEALQTYHHEVTTLKAEVRALREELARANNRNENAATQESIRQLASSIQEVDRKRMSDNEKVLKELRGIGRAVAPTTPTKKVPDEVTPKGEQYEYTIKEGDTLIEIVKGLRELGVSVTQAQVEKANPNVNWGKLRVGKRIVIPAAVPR
jgi:predicted RNase H-like nuclease (RuvC/YqgF family)